MGNVVVLIMILNVFDLKGFDMENKTTKNLNALLRARNSLLWMTTKEELRAERSIIEGAGSAGYETFLWDCSTGLSDSSGKVVDGLLKDPNAILNQIKDDKSGRKVFVLRDMHRFFVDPFVTRGLKSTARQLQSAVKSEARAIVVLSPVSEIPPDLSGQVMMVDFPLPNREEMTKILDTIIESQPDEIKKKVCPNGVREVCIDAAMGLSADEATSCFSRSLVMTKTIDPQLVSNEKKQVVAREKVLSWHDPDPRGLDSIGGLENLKKWLVIRQSGFSKKAREYGLPAPRGVLLVGVPGCGKSLTAKSVAAAWKMPLLRLDMGALRSKWVGESEANIRKALQVAETVSPCVVWLDEIEKSLAGSTGQSGDSGVAADALGTILSWMQERSGSVFVVATANKVEDLPPELLRKGRFDEIFFVDLPQLDERKAILRTILKQYNQDGEKVDANTVAESTDGFSGAEIAALIPEAMFVAFADKERKINTDDLVSVINTTVPLSKTSSERIDAIRKWAVGRARPASKVVTKKSVSGRELDL